MWEPDSVGGAYSAQGKAQRQVLPQTQHNAAHFGGTGVLAQQHSREFRQKHWFGGGHSGRELQTGTEGTTHEGGKHLERGAGRPDTGRGVLLIKIQCEQ